ncbi:CccB [Lysinibacillus sphaericus]|uniref:Cytochrome c-551 n=1 Tax=Lysinibacillus sphaericus TaxID=1421 RepID=A0A2S5CW41_LYSSH|nr:cytochrome c [Lysinibacillus sphaericus]OEB99838.1 CccB [Lysinibacillus sphaericus]POZ55010.1 Cytochrome c-551 [Lysinibacillus sphaericus]
MKKAMLTLVFGSAIFLAACGGGGDKAATGNKDTAAEPDGKAIAMKSCVSCHGGELQGMGNTPALNNVGSRLSEQEILDVINNGRGAMPAGLIKGADAEAVAKWLATQK